MSLSGNVSLLATRIGQEIKAVRAEIVSALAGKVNTSLLGADSGVAQLDSNGMLEPNQRPIIPGTFERWSSISGGVISPTTDSILKDVILSASVTVNEPSGWWEREVLRFEFYNNSGTDKTVTFHGNYKISTGITRGPYTVPNGQSLLAAVEYSWNQSKWVITAATISAS